MNTSATPSPPPGLPDPAGLRPTHVNTLHNHSFGQPPVAPLLPCDLASATALLQQYKMEMHQQQQAASAPLGPQTSARSSRPGISAPHPTSHDAAAEVAGRKGVDIELQILLEIASVACVNSNRIDLSLLSFKQRLAFADLVRYKQCQLQQMSQQASLLLHQLEKNRDGYLDPSRLLVLFPNARAALAKSSPVGAPVGAGVGVGLNLGSACPPPGSHLDVPCPPVQWPGAFDSVSEDSGASHASGASAARVALPGVRGGPSPAAEPLNTAAEHEHEHPEDVYVGQPFTRNNARSHTTPALRPTPDLINKVREDSEAFHSVADGDLFKRFLSISSSLAGSALADAAAATASGEASPSGGDERVRDDADGSNLFSDFGVLQQQGALSLQKPMEDTEDSEEAAGTHVTDNAPFFQRNMRRTTTVPHGSVASKVMLLNGSLSRDLLQAPGPAGGLPDFGAHSKGDFGGMCTPTQSAKNGRCVRIDASAIAAAVGTKPDYTNLIDGNGITSLLGDLQRLQEASASVQAAGLTTPAGDANSVFQRTNRRTTTLPSTMANVKIRATDVQRVLHVKGRCKPCAFYYNKRKGCRNGLGCEFCHHEEHSKLTLKQWKKHQQRAYRTKLQDECDGKEGSGIDYPSSSLLLEPNDGSVISPFGSGHVAPGSELQHPLIPHTYSLNPRACIGDPCRMDHCNQSDAT